MTRRRRSGNPRNWSICPVNRRMLMIGKFGVILIANKIERGEKVFSRAIDAHKISKSGVAAVLAAVDPFHDKPIDDLIGWPDQLTRPSVVRKWKNSYTIKAKDDGGSILIYHWPMAEGSQQYKAVRAINVITNYDQVNKGTFAGPLVIYNMTAAQSAEPALPLELADGTNAAIPYVDDGPGRLIGMGIEVRDVTADLYKQGTVTVFEVPQTLDDVSTLVTVPITFGSVTTSTTALSGVRVLAPPSNLATMMELPTTRQWDAKDGAYVVIPFSAKDNNPRTRSTLIPIINQYDVLDPPNITVPALNNSTSTSGCPVQTLDNSLLPTQSRGIYLTGLNANSTFTITVQFYWETFPSPISDIRTLASPSACFDPKALALISLLMQQLPIGVPVGDNNSGDWFWEIVQEVLPVLGGVTAAMFPEFAPLIAPAAAMGTSYAKRRLEPKPQPKPHTKPVLTKQVAQVAQLKQKKMQVTKPAQLKARSRK